MFCSSLAALFLCFSQGAADAGRDALVLVMHSLLPSVFPLACAAKIIQKTNLGTVCGGCVPRPVRRIFGISRTGCGIVLVSLFCGFPNGAILLSDALSDGMLDAEEAERLLPLCNAASPGFLFGYVAALRGSVWDSLFLYTQQTVFLFTSAAVGAKPVREQKTEEIHVMPSAAVAAIGESAVASVGIAGFVVFFAAIGGSLAEVSARFGFSVPFRIYGLLGELTAAVAQYGKSAPLCVLGALTAFGGIAVNAQIFAFSGKIRKRRFLWAKTLLVPFCFGAGLFAEETGAMRYTGAVLAAVALCALIRPAFKKQKTAGV